jgi:non-specific serine/threonine protein kinase
MSRIRGAAIGLAVAASAIAGCGAGSTSTATTAGAGSPATTRTSTSATRARVTARAAPRLGPPLAGIPVNRWQIRPHALLSRSEVSATRVGKTVYVVGGFQADLRSTTRVELMDSRTGRWRIGVPLPQALNHMNAVAYHGALYILGGYTQTGDTSGGATNRFWRFDAVSGRWQRQPDAPVARAAAGAAVLGNRLYVAGGRNDDQTSLASLAIYDFRTRRWSVGPSLHRAREHVAAVAAGGAIWLLGGRALGQGNFADVERYTPGSRAWQQRTPMPLARSSFQAVFADGRIVVVGGEDGGSTFSEVDALRPATGRWQRLPDLPTARHGLGLAAAGPLVWAIEGGPQAGLTTSDTVQRLRLGR